MQVTNPTLAASPISARKSGAIDRNADAYGSLLEWAPPHRAPQSSGAFVTRPEIKASAITTRVLFVGGLWMTDKPVAAWRPLVAENPIERKFRPVVDLFKSELVERRVGEFNAPAKASKFEELALVPIEGDLDPELAAVRKLSELELKIEIVRFLKPAAAATGITSGKLLAVSENYSAQSIDGNSVVIHENMALEREVKPGELVTLAYDGAGKAAVFEGLAHDIHIQADWMPREQHNYMRMVMFDALSMMQEPLADDERVKKAMHYALESTINYFGLEQTRLRLADIELTVNEFVGPSFGDLDLSSKADSTQLSAPAVARRNRP
ncbi:hypothetical protein [Hydrogenophaga sp. 2FB]|uniref:KfrB domain-containing protein n=1 Tax=Hydrogenophaga sp. 2FB TaxID=2502187 RepID=UPI0010F4D02D|nr:hypothetical protein [Hydrogenophaga sp. 2FB]